MISAGDRRQTIVAIGSSSAPALRGVVRMTGDDAVAVLQRMLLGTPLLAEARLSQRESDSNPPSRLGGRVGACSGEGSAGSPLLAEARLSQRESDRSAECLSSLRRPTRLLLTLQLAAPLGSLDVAAMVWPTGRSYTGQPSVEIQTFGAAPLLEAVVQAACAAGARPAGPGEFTMRAFLAGRLDLAQAEAVLGVIDATSRGQLDAALNQLAGNLFRPLKQVRDELLNLLADIEAGLDFVDEDISFIDEATIERQLTVACQQLHGTLQQLTTRHRSHNSLDIVLRGAPNAGKSSLLNALLGRPAALVSDQAGTTRDVVCAEANLSGYPIRLLDTAGIESQPDGISQQSQLAGVEAEKTASLVLGCVDHREITLETAASFPGHSDRTCVPVATQCDRDATAERLAQLRQQGWVVTSAVSGQGLDELRQRVAERLEQPAAAETGVSVTATRCHDSLQRALQTLETARQQAGSGMGQEWIADELRMALTAIAEVTGEIYTDDILDRVFSRFCIGK